jgi:hypothetical protein
MATIEAAHLPAFDRLQVRPEPCARMQFRGIGGHALHVAAVCGPSGQARGDEVTTMNRGAVPADDPAARHRASSRLPKGQPSGRVAGAVWAVDSALALRGDGGERRELIPGPPLREQGRLAYGGRRADATGQGVKARGLDAEEAVALSLGPLLNAGQVSPRQRVMAASSRWQARRAGVCGRRRLAWHKRPSWRGCSGPPNASRITAAIRLRGHTWPREP